MTTTRMNNKIPPHIAFLLRSLLHQSILGSLVFLARSLRPSIANSAKPHWTSGCLSAEGVRQVERHSLGISLFLTVFYVCSLSNVGYGASVGWCSWKRFERLANILFCWEGENLCDFYAFLHILFFWRGFRNIRYTWRLNKVMKKRFIASLLWVGSFERNKKVQICFDLLNRENYTGTLQFWGPSINF